MLIHCAHFTVCVHSAVPGCGAVPVLAGLEKGDKRGTNGAQCGRVSGRLRFLGFYLHELELQQNAKI